MNTTNQNYSYGKPGMPIIFLLDRNREIDMVLGKSKNQEAIKALIDILDILYSTIKENVITKNNIDILINHLESKHQSVWFEAGKRLIQLSHYFSDVEHGIRNASTSPKTSIRVHLIQSIWQEKPPHNLLIDLLDIALKDKSSKVRAFAISRIGQLKLIEFKNDILKLKTTGKNSKIIDEIDIALKAFQ